MTGEELGAIEAREAAATPGPWVWDVNSRNNVVHLRTDHSGHVYVMGFKRWGMQGAAPTFQVYRKYEGPLYERGSIGVFRADNFTKSFPGKEHHVGWDDCIDHPDAEFIAHARRDVPALLAEAKRLNADNERLRRERDAAVADLAAAHHGNLIPCETCKFRYDTPCKMSCDPESAVDWEWRGVRE